MSRKKSLLLMGSTGFLGSAVLDRLKSEHLQDWEILITRSTSSENPISFTLLDSNLKPSSTLDASNLTEFSESDLVVINCASSRNSRDEELSQEGNFGFPKRVLEVLLTVKGLKTKWIQIETFWQYSKTPIPDASYVLWKNRFSAMLTDSPRNENFEVEKLVLPHLIGPHDGPNRFLPRTFLKLLKNEDAPVDSPDELFCLADVRDVSDHLVRTLGSTGKSKDSSVLLFPYYELSLREIIFRFLATVESSSRIQFDSIVKISNPTLIFSEQPPLMTSERQILRSLGSTFADIAQWLSELQQIDNLQ